MLKKCLAGLALASAIVSTTSAQDAKTAIGDASKAMGVDKLKTVQFWLEQNARMLGTKGPTLSTWRPRKDKSHATNLTAS